MDYLQKDDTIPAYPDDMDDQDGTSWNDDNPTLDITKPRYTESDEHFFMDYDAPTRYANNLTPMERIRQNDP